MPPPTHHLAILHPEPLRLILAGEKTIESRLSRVRATPYGRVAAGDILHLKRAGGPVLGRATVARVEQYGDLTPVAVQAAAERYREELRWAPAFLAAKANCRYAVLIWLADVAVVEPWAHRQRGRAGWVVLGPDPRSP